MTGGKKLRQSFNMTELRALQHFLEIAYSDYEHSDTETGKKTCEEIDRLRVKIQQMILQRRKVR